MEDNQFTGRRLTRTWLWCFCVMNSEPLAPSCQCQAPCSSKYTWIPGVCLSNRKAGAEILPMVHPPSSPSAFWVPPKGCRRKQLEVFVLYNLSYFLFFSKILFFFFLEGCKWHLTGLRVDKMAHRVKALPPSLITWPWYLPHGEGQLAPESCSLMARVFSGIHVTLFYTRIN